MVCRSEPAKQLGLQSKQMDAETATGTIGATATKPVPQSALCRRSSWKTIKEVELETLKWGARFNNMYLLGPVGNTPPAKAEEVYYVNLNTPNKFE